MDNLQQQLRGALIKRALGCLEEEETNEFTVDNGVRTLVKVRTAKKYYPPDLSAVKMLLDGVRTYADYSDEELEAESTRLMEELRREIINDTDPLQD